MFHAFMDSPVGELLLASDGKNLTGLHFENYFQIFFAAKKDSQRKEDLATFVETKQQLVEYFARKRKTFDVPLKMEGSAFQRRVWQELLKIEYGTTISYGELATRIGNPNASRAVGLANGRNPIAVIVPCHRVIGADGSLTGYGGGLNNKVCLLEIEQVLAETEQLKIGLVRA